MSWWMVQVKSKLPHMSKIFWGEIAEERNQFWRDREWKYNKGKYAMIFIKE